MGSLSNLYISQSYQSLAHLGTNNALVPGTYVELQDGLGQSLNINFNGTNISSSGNIYAANITASVIDTGSFVTTSSFNAYVATQDTKNATLATYTASVNQKFSNIGTQSGSWDNTNLNAFTASQLTKDATLQNVTASLQSYTASQNIINTNVGLSASIYETKFNTIATQSGSWDNTSLNAFSASQLTKDATLAIYTASVDQKFANIGAQSGSWVTESETGSFARVDVTNTFTQPQIISAAITASSARIANLNYPTTDGTYSGQVLQTDAAGTLSFGNVVGMYQTVRNGEATSLTVGTAVYVSGSQGANPIVYRADASNASKMPVQYIISETITSGGTGRALLLGVLEGYNVGAATAGTLFYVDGNGTLTTTRPTGSSDLVQPIAIVTKTGAGGQLSVLNPGPVLLPNIQTGYVWVGNGNNQPLAVATSSLVTSPTDITALNAFTASQNTKNSTLETYTASVNTQLTNLSTSQSIDNQKWINISTQSGSWGISGGTVSSSAQIVELGFLQTSSFQSYTSSQDTKNITLASVTASLQQQLTNIGSQSGSWITESESGSFLVTASVNLNTITFTKGDASTFNIIVNTGSAGTTTDLTSLNAFTASQETKNTTLSNVTSSLQQQLTNIGSQSGSWVTESETGSFIVTASVNLNTITFTKGDTTTFNITVNTGSTATPTDISSLNAFTASQETKNTTLASVTASLQSYTASQDVINTNVGLSASLYNIQFGTIGSKSGSWDNTSLNAFTQSQNTINSNVALSASLYETKFATIGTQSGSWGGGSIDTGSFVTTSSFNSYTSSTNSRLSNIESKTGSYATTGSNTFFGGQQIVGPIQAADTNYGPQWVPGVVFQGVGSSSVAYDQFINGGNYDGFHVQSNINAGTDFQDLPSDTFVLNTWLNIPTNTGNHPAPRFTRGLEITGSTSMQSLTASLQQGYVWVGNANGRTTTVATSSFGGGGAAFPYSGTASISGSLQVTGSMSGLPNELTVASNTASIDFTKGNFFSITLPASATTHFTVANTIKGQTINIQINQPAGASTGSVAFAPSILFAGGNDYQATATGSAIDLLTLVAITGSSVLATSIKNFL